MTTSLKVSANNANRKRMHFFLKRINKAYGTDFELIEKTNEIYYTVENNSNVKFYVLIADAMLKYGYGETYKQVTECCL